MVALIGAAATVTVAFIQIVPRFLEEAEATSVSGGPATPLPFQTSTTIVLPTLPASAAAGPVPTMAAARGPLQWQAALEARGGDLEPRWVLGDPIASDVRVRAGEIEFAILRGNASTGASFKSAISSNFVAEMDLRVRPGSNMRFYWTIRSSEDAQHQVRVDTDDEEVWLSHFFPRLERADRFTPRMPVAGLLTGRLVRLGVVAEDRGYTLYLDGQPIVDAPDARLAGAPSAPFALSAEGREGAVTLAGLRTYALP